MARQKVNTNGATCHPDKAYWALGLCEQCYKRQKARKYREDPGRAHGLPAGAYDAIGLLSDDAALLLSAVTYLKGAQ